MQPKDSYRAGNEIYSAYLLTDFYPTEALLVNLGLRYEMSKQWVRYASDGGDWYSRRRNLDKNDLFPALNLKYAVNPTNSIRFSASRTVTRPSFIEMAPSSIKSPTVRHKSAVTKSCRTVTTTTSTYVTNASARTATCSP